MAATAPATRERAERLAAGLPSFTVRALRVAANVVHGVHGRRRRGPGETFWQFRHYQPGDPVTAIDWRRTAGTADVFVREREWEVAQSVWLWCDRSASMDYASAAGLETKRSRASLLALTLAVLLLQGGETVGLIGRNPRTGQGRPMLDRVADLLSRDRTEGNGLPPPVALARHSQTVLFGDFLESLPEIEARLRALARGEVAGHLVHVIDPAEESLPFRGRIRFTGPEEEEGVLIGRVESVRRRYVDRFGGHRDALREIARSVGWHYLAHHTDRPPEPTLLALHAALAGHHDRH